MHNLCIAHYDLLHCRLTIPQVNNCSFYFEESLLFRTLTWFVLTNLTLYSTFDSKRQR